MPDSGSTDLIESGSDPDPKHYCLLEVDSENFVFSNGDGLNLLFTRPDVPYGGFFTQLGELHTIYHIW
jgi:hypothetical protein